MLHERGPERGWSTIAVSQQPRLGGSRRPVGRGNETRVHEHPPRSGARGRELAKVATAPTATLAHGPRRRPEALLREPRG